MNIKHFILFLSSTGISISIRAQNVETSPTDSLTLNEAVVEGKRMEQKNDRLWIYPSKAEIENSTTVFSLLKKLPLKHVTVNDISNSISSPYGVVQIYINDAPASHQDLLSLNLKLIRRIELIDLPGIRYGENTAAVIRVITRKANDGYSLGLYATHLADEANGSINAYGKTVWGNSGFDVDFQTSYNHTDNPLSLYCDRYAMADGTTLIRTRNDSYSHTHANSRSGSMRYSYSLPDKFYLQSTVSANFNRTPYSQSVCRINTASDTYEQINDDTSKYSQPSVEVYTTLNLTAKQTLIANISTTFGQSESTTRHESPVWEYAYATDGKFRNFGSEICYENRLKPFTITSGFEYSRQHTSNHYTGDTETHSCLRTSYERLYAELSGRIAKFGYRGGIGFSHSYVNQDGTRTDDAFFRSSLLLSYQISTPHQLRYSLSYAPYTSRFRNLSDVSIQTDDLNIERGNPQLRSYRRIEQILSFSFNYARVQAELSAMVRLNRNPVMSRTFRDEEGKFIHTQANQPFCNMYNPSGYIHIRIIPDKLSFLLWGGYYHFDNKGSDYRHKTDEVTFTGSLYAYLGRFSLSAEYNHGWRFCEDEGKSITYPSYAMSATYRLPLRHGHELTFGINASQFGRPEVHMQDIEILNKYVRQSIRTYSRYAGNLFMFSVNWRFSQGKKPKEIEQRLKRKTVDSGLM